MIHYLTNFSKPYIFALCLFFAMETAAQALPVNQRLLKSNQSIVIQTCPKQKHQVTVLQKSLELAKFASVAIIALGVNFVLDYATIFVHECGHSCASKLLWGGPIHFEVFHREHSGISKLLRPHGGGTHFPPGEKSKSSVLLAILSGPLLGQLFLEFQLRVIGKMVKKQDDSFAHNDRIKKGFGQSCKALYKLFKEVIWKNSGTRITKKQYKTLLLHFLNICTALRATEHFFYGFTPLSRDLRALSPQYANGMSDGKILWHQLFDIPIDTLQAVDINSLKLAIVFLSVFGYCCILHG